MELCDSTIMMIEIIGSKLDSLYNRKLILDP